jgi:putative peptidoglycan lipid II flippase
MVNIGLNIIFDYIFVNTLGAPGLVLATLGVNCNSVFLLLFILNRKLNGLPIMEWSLPILGLAGASVVAGVTSFATLQLCQIFLGNHGLITLLLQLVISSSVGLCLFGIITAIMKVPEVNIFATKLLQHFVK